MREFNHKGDKEHEGRHRGRHGGRHEGRQQHHGAKTFRRGRALDFLGLLEVKRETLKQQLEAPEYQEIQSILLGELKAVEMIIKEYVRHFELNESEDPTILPEDKEQAASQSEAGGEGDLNS